MLPDKTTQLVDKFVTPFNADNVPELQFRKAKQEARSKLKGTLAYGSAALLGAMNQGVLRFVERKARFVWDTMKTVVPVTIEKAYPELAADLKSFLEQQLAKTIQLASRDMEESRVHLNYPTGYTLEAQASLKNILPTINAEIELFCATYTQAMNQQTTPISGMSVTMGHGSNLAIGTQGNVSQSTTTVNVQSVFKELRHAIEDNVSDNNLRLDILKEALELERAHGTTSFKARCERFVELVKTAGAAWVVIEPILSKLLS